MPTSVEDALKMLAANAERTALLEKQIDGLLLEKAHMTRTISRQSKRIAAQRRRIARFHEERELERELRRLRQALLDIESSADPRRTARLAVRQVDFS